MLPPALFVTVRTRVLARVRSGLLAHVRRRSDEAMHISPIKTQRDYRRILREIEGLMNAKRNTPEGDRLDMLVTLVEAWEANRYPLDLPVRPL